MARGLPYFKWYPADAEMDTKYRSMDDAERGFYLTCLNYSWINGGLPIDPSLRAKALGRRRSEADKRWIGVGPCFQPSENDPELLINPRQEIERLKAISKSEQATDAVQKRYGRTFGRTTEKDIPVAPRTVARADSVSVSDSGFDSKKTSLPPEKSLTLQPSERSAIRDGLAAFLERWRTLTKRSQHMQGAEGAWVAVVKPDRIDAALECLERYGKSDEVSRGIVSNPDKWLYEQACDNWSGTWPPVRASPKSSKRDDLIAHRNEVSEIAKFIGGIGGEK